MNRLLLRALVDPKQDGCPAVNAPPQLSSRLVQEPTCLIAIDTGVAQDPGESPAFEFAMKWDHERSRAVLVLETDVATALADDHPPKLLERGD